MCDIQRNGRNSGSRTDRFCKATSAITLPHTLLFVLTAVITLNGRFHQRTHPIPDDGTGVRIEHMSLVVRMFHFQTIVSGLNIFVGGDLVARSVDISFDLSLLELKLVSTKVKRLGNRTEPSYRYFASSRDYSPSIRNTCFSTCYSVPPSSSTSR